MHRPATEHHRTRRRAAVPALGAVLAAAAALASGCTPPPKTTGDHEIRLDDKAMRQADREMVREPFADQSKKAVLRQKTLFEYHFEPGMPELTSLGKRDLHTLSVQLKAGGTLSVRRGTASEALYAARLETVRTQLIAEGIPADKVQFTNTLAGGTGISAAGALFIQDSLRGAQAPALPAGEVLDPRGGAPTEAEAPK